jgi:hypothetical protein
MNPATRFRSAIASIFTTAVARSRAREALCSAPDRANPERLLEVAKAGSC